MNSYRIAALTGLLFAFAVPTIAQEQKKGELALYAPGTSFGQYWSDNITLQNGTDMMIRVRLGARRYPSGERVSFSLNSSQPSFEQTFTLDPHSVPVGFRITGTDEGLTSRSVPTTLVMIREEGDILAEKFFTHIWRVFDNGDLRMDLKTPFIETVGSRGYPPGEYTFLSRKSGAVLSIGGLTLVLEAGETVKVSLREPVEDFDFFVP